MIIDRKSKSSVTVACFLPVRAKDLSAPLYHKNTVESFTGKLVKHTRKPCQARNEMAKGKGLQKIQWNKMAKAEKGNINPVQTTSDGIAPHIGTLSTTWG
jgi:hypothetical protein